MKKLLLKTILVLSLMLIAPIVLAAPAIPHQFYGSVDFSDGPAPDGLIIEAKIDNIVVASASVVDGKYGYSPSLFFVTDPDANRQGKTVEFFVGGIDSGQSAVFVNGGYSKKDISVEGTVGTIERGEDEVIEDETVAVAPSSSTNIKMGDSLSITISSDASTNATIEKIEKMPSGNVAVFSGKNLLNAFEIKISGENINISVTMSYDDSAIDENTIAPYRFDGTSWVEIDPFTIDKPANKISFNISSGQTPYAVFGELPVVPCDDGSSGGGSGSGGGGGGGGSSYTPPAPTTLGQAAQNADINKDDKIDLFDFNTLMVNWGSATTNNIADVDKNGTVDIFDFNLLMIYWTG